MGVVAGYTVCNDYAVRDYLENWYRPNLRVKNRDGATVLGPWLVDAADVPDPHALALRTCVNGKLTQQGNTGDMINDVPALIEYLSGFMTLQRRRRDPDRHARRRGQRRCRRRGGHRDRRHRAPGQHHRRRRDCGPIGTPMRIHHLIDGKPVDSTRALRDRQPGHAGGAGRGGGRRRGRGQRRGRRRQGRLPDLGRAAGHRARAADAQARRPDHGPRARDRADRNHATPAR